MSGQTLGRVGLGVRVGLGDGRRGKGTLPTPVPVVFLMKGEAQFPQIMEMELVHKC